MRIGYRSGAVALKLALCLSLAGSAALMGGCSNTAAGALLGAFVGGAIGGDAEGAVADLQVVSEHRSDSFFANCREVNIDQLLLCRQLNS